jgi:protein-L-isoaspartate O-methyltransferase
MLDPTATHLPVLESLLSDGTVKKVLEFGCGLFSTKAFADAGCNVTAIEMQHEEWYRRVREALPSVELHLALGPTAWSGVPLDGRYDLIFVDGHGDSRPECLMWAKDHADLIVAHDTEHPYYGWDRADMSGFVATVHDALSPTTTVWRRAD